MEALIPLRHCYSTRKFEINSPSSNSCTIEVKEENSSLLTGSIITQKIEKERMQPYWVVHILKVACGKTDDEHQEVIGGGWARVPTQKAKSKSRGGYVVHGHLSAGRTYEMLAFCVMPNELLHTQFPDHTPHFLWMPSIS